MAEYTSDYLLDQKVKIFQGVDTYRTSSDAVLVSSLVDNLKTAEKVLDVGSGVGGISLCLAFRFQKNEMMGLEIQKELVHLSNMSAEANGFENLHYVECDISKKNEFLKNGSFDHVVTNPPYEKNGMKSPNKSKALAHNEQSISLEGWLLFCLKMLKPYGFLYLIHRAEALDNILNILHHKTGNIHVIPIYSKEGQRAKRVMIKAQKDSKSPLIIEPPLIIHDQNNGYTKKAKDILRSGQALNE